MELKTANTIREQLGGVRFSVMTGANTFVADNNSLRFKIGRNSHKVTHVRITLTPADLYNVEFLNVRGLNCKTLATEEGVYADMLQSTFEEHTGLYTRF